MGKYWACKKADVEIGKCNRVNLRGIPIGIFKTETGYYAWLDICPHFGAPVCKGEICGTRLPSNVYEYRYGLENQILRCPWHGWEFNIETGKNLVNERIQLKGFPISIEGNDLFVVLTH